MQKLPPRSKFCTRLLNTLDDWSHFKAKLQSFDKLFLFGIIIAYNNKVVGLHAKIKVRINSEIIDTTTGRIIFNRIVPDEMGFINQLLVKKAFGGLIGKMFTLLGNKVTAKLLDDL